MSQFTSKNDRKPGLFFPGPRCGSYLVAHSHLQDLKGGQLQKVQGHLILETDL